MLVDTPLFVTVPGCIECRAPKDEGAMSTETFFYANCWKQTMRYLADARLEDDHASAAIRLRFHKDKVRFNVELA